MGPGAFRTDFAGRSLTQSAAAIDGTQAGDPAKAATAIIAAVEHATPPGFLLLGSDALAGYRGVAEARIAEVTQWEALSASTDYSG